MAKRAGVLMVGLSKQTRPKHQARFEQWFPELLEAASGKADLKLGRRFDERRALLSHVRSACLAAFASHGYAYVFRTRREPQSQKLPRLNDPVGSSLRYRTFT